MLNPWVLLGIVLAFAGSNAWSFHEGRHYSTISIEAGQKQAADKAAAEAKANAEIDYGVQQELALEQQRHELLSETHHNLVVEAITKEKVIRQQQPPVATGGAIDCNTPSGTFRVLLDSIRASNKGAAPATGAGDGAVSGGNGTSGPVAGSDAVRTGQHSMDPLDVSK